MNAILFWKQTVMSVDGCDILFLNYCLLMFYGCSGALVCEHALNQWFPTFFAARILCQVRAFLVPPKNFEIYVAL